MSQLEKAMREWNNLEINTESPNSADHAISVACNLIAELDSALSKSNARISELSAAPSLEAQPAGEVVYQVQHAIGPDWTDVTKTVYDKWWRENRRVIHLTAMAQGDKHE